eukprot:gene5991-6687_t
MIALVQFVAGTPPQIDNFVIRKPAPIIENQITSYLMFLDCSGTGDPLPTFKFKKKGGKFITKDYKDKRLAVTDNVLTITNVNATDNGIYICYATNQLGTVIKELNVRLSVLGQFSYESRMDRDTRAHSVTLYKDTVLPCPPRSYTFPLTIEWGSVPSGSYPSARTKRIPLSNRVFYGKDGGLYFANVLPEDIRLINNDYRGIQCLITSSKSMRASNKFTLRQDGDFGPTYTRDANIATFMDPITIIAKDQESTFTCGGKGMPTPSVYWYKDGVLIRNIRASETNFVGYTLANGGVELRISRPRKEDEGVFKCFVNNTYGGKEQVATLLVDFKPYWTKEIEDVTLMEEGTQLFNATTEAKPPVKCEWYKNGTLLTASQHVWIQGCAMRVINARQIDRGMYVLIARNRAGAISTQAYVNVAAVKPSFKVRLPDPMYLFRGRIGRIPCNATGGPIPTKTWHFNNRIIDKTFKRLSVDGNGTLTILNVQDSDKGFYRCDARNRQGFASITANVIIVEPTAITQIPSAPNGATIKRGRDIVLVCDASYDKNLQLRIDWQKDGELIKTFDSRFSLEQRVGDAAPRLLVIKSLKYEDRGNYTCNAYTVLSTVTNVRSVDSKTSYLSVSAPPETPLSIRVASCQNFRPLLTWTVTEANRDTMKYVQVEYTSTYHDDANTWYVAGQSFGESANQFQFGGPRSPAVLPGFATIKLRVVAYNQVGGSLPSVPTPQSTCTTPAKRPSKNPTNVRFGNMTTKGSLTIQWNAMKLIERNGLNFVYEVKHRKVGGSWDRGVNVTNVTSYTVSRITDETQYEACILTYNIKGPSTARPSCVTDYSYQEKPRLAPTGVIITKTGYTGADISWKPVVVTTGNIKGYRIYYWNVTAPFRPVLTRGLKKRRRRRAVDLAPTAAKPAVVEYLVGSDTRLLQNISGLVPALRYHVYMTAFNSGGEGPRSNVLVFETRATKSGFPDNIKMTVYGDVLHVQWESPLEPNGQTTGFIIRLEPKRDAMKKKSLDMIVVDRIDREYYIRGMTPCKFYDVLVGAQNVAGEGRLFRRRMAVSYPDIPGTPNLPRVVPYDANAVNVTYKLPGYGGLPTKFKVFYKHKDAAFYDANSYFSSEFVEQVNFLKQPWQTVKGLPELEYAFWTVGENKLGSSVPSDLVISQVMPYTRPGIRTVEGPWYTSRWFVGVLSCVVFAIIVLVVILLLVNYTGGQKYEVLVNLKEKSGAESNGQTATQFQRMEEKDEPDYRDPPIQLNEVASSAAPPPRYPSQTSIEKRHMTDEQDSMAEYGDDSRFREDGSFIGQYGEEKRREDVEDDDDDDDEGNDSMFI